MEPGDLRSRREDTPTKYLFEGELLPETESEIGILRPSAMRGEPVTQGYFSSDNALGEMLGPLNEKAIPTGSLILVQLPPHTPSPAFLTHLVATISCESDITVISHNPISFEDSKVNSLPLGQLPQIIQLAALSRALKVKRQLVLIADLELDLQFVRLLLRMQRKGGHSMILFTADVRNIGYLSDYMIEVEQVSMSSKLEAEKWGATYRERIWVARVAKSLTPSQFKPARLEVDSSGIMITAPSNN